MGFEIVTKVETVTAAITGADVYQCDVGNQLVSNVKDLNVQEIKDNNTDVFLCN